MGKIPKAYLDARFVIDWKVKIPLSLYERGLGVRGTMRLFCFSDNRKKAAAIEKIGSRLKGVDNDLL